jgi:hypothetical protein
MKKPKSKTISRQALICWINRQRQELKNQTPQTKMGMLYLDGKSEMLDRIEQHVKK